MANNTSAKFSLKDWKFWEWVKGNWSTIKEFIKVGGPWLISLQFFADNIPMQIFITALGKLILDIGHYYIKD